MTTYKLIYFDIKGRAEVARLLFEAAGQIYEDKLLPLTKTEDKRPSFTSEWFELKPTLPFGQLPVLEVTDLETSKSFQITQSHAIERYLANKFNLAGKNEVERAHCDMLMEQMIDVMNQIIVAYFMMGGCDYKSAAVQEVYRDKVPPGLKFIENILVANKQGNGFLVGNSLTLADLFLVYLYDYLKDSKAEILVKLPALKQHDEKIRSLPKLGEYLKKRDSARLTAFD